MEGGPLAETLRSQCRGPRFDLWLGTRSHVLQLKVCIITSPGWMHETSVRAWCTGKTQRDQVEREVGRGDLVGEYVTPWLIHVNV